jgi:hypothetical protein
MKRKHYYLLLTVLGLLIPYSVFISWVFENGLDIPLMISEITSDKVSATAWLDAIVAGVVLLVLMLTEGRETKVPHLWLPVLTTLTVGVSLGLPLFLYLREVGRENA